MKRKNKILIIIAIVLGTPFLAIVIVFAMAKYNNPGVSVKEIYDYAVSNASNKIATRSDKQKTDKKQSQPDTGLSRDIEAEKIGLIGKHVYYSENSLFSEKRSEEQNASIRKYIESLDKNLNEDVYITSCMYYPSTERIDISASAYVNGVVLSYFPYKASTEDDDGMVQKFSRMVRPDIDTSDLKDPEELIADVKAFALQNTDDMCMDRGDAIYGTYLLKYDMETESLFYEYTLNRWSYVNVDAKTGEITGWNFYDGVVY